MRGCARKAGVAEGSARGQPPGEGRAGHLAKGDVRMPEGLALGLGAIVGAQIGGALSSRVKGVWIVRALAVALVLVAVRLLF